MPFDPFTADSLPPEEIATLKEMERRNRDLGASEFLQMLKTERAPFHLRAEARMLLHFLSPRSGDRVLDAGSGVGRIAMHVAPPESRSLSVWIYRPLHSGN